MTSHRLTELILAGLAVVWSAWLVGFRTYDTSPVFEVFRLWHLPEIIMILWPAAIGVCLFFMSLPRRRLAHLPMCLFWVFIAAAVAENNITLTAVPVYASIALLHFGCYAVWRA